jgi:putative nucleotidyltransferase with HDIG domain
MRMPEMDGARFLAEVRQRYPHTVRIVLSGQAGRDAALRSVDVAHQYLSKPCSAEALKATLARACALRSLLATESLHQIVSQMKSLPSLPTLYAEIVEEMNSPDPSIQKVGQIIGQDVAMAAKVLQIVNSSFFGLHCHVPSPAQAVMLLGAEVIKALVLSAQVFARLDTQLVAEFFVDALWIHSQATGTLARQIAKEEQADQRTTEFAFMAGLLHDVGKLVLAGSRPKQYAEVLDLHRGKGLLLWEAECEVFGSSHAEVGAYLLGLWGLPDPIVEAVAWHHRPGDLHVDSFCPLTAVHAANCLAHEGPAQSSDSPAAPVDLEYLERIGLGHRLDTWHDLWQTFASKGDAA